MTKVDLAYAAGFIDGEGCIQITHHMNHNKRNSYIKLMVGNTNEEVLLWFKYMFGGSIQPVKEDRTRNHKACFSWIVASKTAAKVLTQVYPYLRVKLPQAKLALDFQATMLKPRDRRKVSDEVLAVREAQEVIMKALNHRGLTLEEGVCLNNEKLV